MKDLLRQIQWLWLNRTAPAALQPIGNPIAESGAYTLPHKAQRLLTPKKARREFNNEIHRLAKQGLTTNFQRRIWLRNVIILALTALIILREAYR
jgi:hypothetical protein